jgi:hypothetical protein
MSGWKQIQFPKRSLEYWMEKVQKPNNPKHIWTFIKIFYGRKMTLKK